MQSVGIGIMLEDDRREFLQEKEAGIVTKKCLIFTGASLIYNDIGI